MSYSVVEMKRRYYLLRSFKFYGAKILFYNINHFPSKWSFGGVKTEPNAYDTHWPILLYAPWLGAVLGFLIIFNPAGINQGKIAKTKPDITIRRSKS